MIPHPAESSDCKSLTITQRRDAVTAWGKIKNDREREKRKNANGELGANNIDWSLTPSRMDEVFDNLDRDWQKLILVQGSRSKQKLIDTHKRKIDDGEGSTIFGLASFAEGIDLPGKYCEHVVIAKIPFGVPTEPEEEALAEWVEARGGNSFRDISLSDASMRLVQAVGRLLRSEKDQGKVTITDNRLLTKFYGKQLLAALPPMKRS